MKWNLRSNRRANDEGSTRTRSKLRKRGVVTAGIVALGAAAGAVPALGLLTPDPAQPYGGNYVLWYANQYAGGIRNFSGCARSMDVNQGIQAGPLVGKVRVTPCIVDVGLDTSDSFRKALTDALSGPPAVTDVAVGLLDGTGRASASELRFRGYVSDVTLPN